MRRSAYALIRLQHLTHNLNLLRSLAPTSKIIAVVKADAYGHGLAKTAQALAQSDAFAVACTHEALALRSAGILHPIICLQGFYSQAELQTIIDANLQTVIHSYHQIKLLQQCRFNSSIQVWLKIDTGMGRLGFQPAEAQQALQKLKTIKKISRVRLMTHFANADLLDAETTQKQLQKFTEVNQRCPGHERSAANSAATLAYSSSLYEWIRPGLCLYGISPFQVENTHPDTSEFKPVMSLRAPLIAIKHCKQGARIGYGGTYTCPRDTRIGIVAIGYADGYPGVFNKPLNVSINGGLAPVVGRVSMDMLTIDISSIDASIGDDVELWGDEIALMEIADAARTISYDLLCRVGSHVQRYYE